MPRRAKKVEPVIFKPKYVASRRHVEGDGYHLFFDHGEDGKNVLKRKLISA